jgi:hypothetical protein
MASIIAETTLGIRPESVWAALRDTGSACKLFPGVLVASRQEGVDRIVTFANGSVARERIVTIDDARRRLVYTVTDGRPAHHNASFQVMDGAGGGSRVVWISDFLPDELEPMIRRLVGEGLEAMRRAMEIA